MLGIFADANYTFVESSGAFKANNETPPESSAYMPIILGARFFHHFCNHRHLAEKIICKKSFDTENQMQKAFGKYICAIFVQMLLIRKVICSAFVGKALKMIL
jgi:hypothetical protein